MADSKLTDLTAKTTLADTDVVYLVEPGGSPADRKITGANLKSQVLASTTFTDHSARHENGGADEISIAGLDGIPTELQNHLDDATAAHAASAISVDSTTLSGTGTDVQASLEELDNTIDNHIADATAAHAASAISFSAGGTIAATDVQAAISEVATDAASALSTHESDTTSVHGITDTSALYRSGGTDVALADGGTGASLTDPGADRIMFWDDSAGGVTWLSAGSGLSISGTEMTASGGISSGTSFPGSPATNDLYYRTDLDLLCFYDGTQWLTATLYRDPMAPGSSLPGTSSPAVYGRFVPWSTDFDLYLEALDLTTYPSATNNGSHYWTISLIKATTTATETTIVSRNTSADTQSQYLLSEMAIGAALGGGSTYKTMYITVTKTGTPGALTAIGALRYRLIVT